MAKTKKLVLIVDDEPGILHFVHISLKLAGFEVITTTSGKWAIHLVQSERPDIMILDMFMEPVTGFEVLRKLRTFSMMPVIACTGVKEAADTAVKLGANDYIIKPFVPNELVKTIQVVLNRQTDKSPDRNDHVPMG